MSKPNDIRKWITALRREDRKQAREDKRRLIRLGLLGRKKGIT